jgi:hypothetical protein
MILRADDKASKPGMFAPAERQLHIRTWLDSKGNAARVAGRNCSLTIGLNSQRKAERDVP